MMITTQERDLLHKLASKNTKPVTGDDLDGMEILVRSGWKVKQIIAVNGETDPHHEAAKLLKYLGE